MTGPTPATERPAALGGYAWTAIAVAAVAVGAAAFAVLFSAPAVQSYPDFVAGYLAVAGAAKDADLWALPLAVAAALGAAFLFHRVAQGLARNADERAAGVRAYASQLMLAAVPAAVATGNLGYRFVADTSLLHLSAAAALLLSALVAAGLRGGRVPPRLAGYAVLGVVLVALVPAEAAAALDRLGVVALAAGNVVVGAFVALFALGAAVMLVTAMRTPARLAPRATFAIVLGSAGLPLAFALLLPGAFTLTSGETLRYPATPVLGAAAAVLAAWAWWDLGRRIARARPLAGADPGAVVSTPAMLALVVAMRYGQTLAPSVSPDDFHFGERLLGWWMTLRHGAVPFVNFVPLHGLLEDDLGGYLSAALFDGTAATVAQSDRLAHGFLAIAAGAALWRVTGSTVMALCAALTLGGRGAWYLLAPVFCMTADESLERHPDRWLALWILVAPFVVLMVPAQGALAAASTAPVAALAAVRWWRSGRCSMRSWPALALLALLLAAAATPIGPMLAGALRFLAEFGPVNQVAYGVPWRASLDLPARPAFAAEVARMSWVAVPVVAAVVLARYPRTGPGRARVAAIALPALLFVLAMIPYAMGRIDATGISRPGVVAVFGWVVLVPLIGCAAFGSRAVPAISLALVFGAATLGANPTLETLLRATDTRVLAGDVGAAGAAGLPAMGRGLSDAAHRQRLLKIRAELDASLPAGRPYLDVTDRTAQHFYLDRPPPLRIPAPYNLVPAAEQLRAVASLARDPPARAVLWADNFDLDGLKLALRAPLLFRFVLDAYEPYEREGIVYGRLRPPGAATGPRGEAELALLDRLFANRSLQWIPASWGRAAAGLADRMRPVQPALGDVPAATHDVAREGDSYRVTGTDPFVVFEVSARPIAPAEAGLLRFEFACARRTAPPGAAPVVPRLQVFFWGDAQAWASEPASLYLNADDGTLIVPLDAYPRYLDLARLRGLRIDLDNGEACTAFTIRNLGLYQRADLADRAGAPGAKGTK